MFITLNEYEQYVGEDEYNQCTDNGSKEYLIENKILYAQSVIIMKLSECALFQDVNNLIPHVIKMWCIHITRYYVHINLNLLAEANGVINKNYLESMKQIVDYCLSKQQIDYIDRKHQKQSYLIQNTYSTDLL